MITLVNQLQLPNPPDHSKSNQVCKRFNVELTDCNHKDPQFQELMEHMLVHTEARPIPPSIDGAHADVFGVPLTLSVHTSLTLITLGLLHFC